MSTTKVCRLGRCTSKPNKVFTSSSPAHSHQFARIPRRFFSSSPPPPAFPKPNSIPKPASASASASTPIPTSQPTLISATSFASSHTRLQSRLRTLQTRLPKFLHPYTTPLLNAPKTYIISFLLLHEITALAPLILLAGGFHYTGWLPSDMIPEGKLEGAREKFERWFGRKGWFGYEKGDGDTDVRSESEEGNSEGKRIVLEIATAYVVTKILLPVRIAVCVWATPWFARGIEVWTRMIRGVR